MAGIARKIIICAAADGLIIQPLCTKGQRPIQPAQIRYEDSSVTSVSRDQIPDTTTSTSFFEAFGIIGVITVSKFSYLVSITRREQVASLFGWPIYVATEVAITPCFSQAAASQSIKRTARSLHSHAPHDLSDESGSSEDEEVQLPRQATDEVDDAGAEDETVPKSSRSSVAEDVIRRRGSYGIFAQRWFSRSGWTLDQKRTMGLSNSPTASPPLVKAEPPASPSSLTLNDDSEDLDSEPTLLPKLLRTAQVLFGSSRSFYFCYDYDITRNLSKRSASTHSSSSLHSQADDAFFWNRHLLDSFISSGHDGLALPVMQGFVGQRQFVVDSQPPQIDDDAKDSLEMRNLPETSATSDGVLGNTVASRSTEKVFQLTLISRRSIRRAGLRYLRRGVDQDGSTANMVESEQLLTPQEWTSKSKAYSFVQIRGSIPVFFTQSPYSLKPVPVLQHSEAANQEACKRHFERIQTVYGKIQVVNLVEKHGIEEPVGTRYKTCVETFNEDAKLDNENVSFEWFDFHSICRGMKFENVSYLLNQLKDTLESMGSTSYEDGSYLDTQKGVLRTNCMDCLDRTNVCQSSFGRHMLEVQLKEEGIDMSAQRDQETTWFNTLWADNGDAVSNQYASTAAMKGDYTRTKKRDYRGALNDLGLSLTRFYNGQAAIDFLLGNVTAQVFDEFESNMMTKDPAVSISKMREQAIELCQKRVIADESEEFHGGWALLSPNVSDTVKAWPLEEIVLLLTNSAIYLCRFDWNLDKVSSFERVELANVTNIKFGTYITSTVSASHMDELRNVGFVVTYQPGKSDIKRTNTRTFSSHGQLVDKQDKGQDKAAGSRQPLGFANLLSGRPKQPQVRKLVFKVPNQDSSTSTTSAGRHQTEIQQTVTICADIERLSLETQLRDPGDEEKGLIEKGQIISLEEARRNTGLLEQLGHSIKKMVWA